MTKTRHSKAEVQKELKKAQQRIKTIERHTGARISLNVDKILADKNRAHALEGLKNISWNKLEAGKNIPKGFVNVEVQGRYYQKKTREWIETKTEVDPSQASRLLKATARREKATGQIEPISISGDVEKAIKYKEKIKTRKQWESFQKRKNRKKADNFVGNIQDMLDYTDEMSADDRRKLKRLKSLIKKDPQKWIKIIEEHKLYDIAGVNMYSSKEQLVDLKENYDTIIEVIENEVGDIDEIYENKMK